MLLAQFEAKDTMESAQRIVEAPQIVEQAPTVVVESSQPTQVVERKTADEAQLSIFDMLEPTLSPVEQEVLEQIAKCNVMGTTPMQAMTLLYELQQKLMNK